MAGGSRPLRWPMTAGLAAARIIRNAPLLLANVQPTKAGSYAVLVVGPGGSTLSADAALTVGTPPTVLTQPTSQSVLRGCDVFLTVVATGTDPLSYQWWKDGLALDGQTDTSLSLNDVHP